MEYVLLTGVTSSIGESIAISLSEKYIIILGGRNLKEISAIKDKLNGDIHLIWHCDFMEEGVAESLILFLMTNNIQPSHFLHLGGLFKIAPIRLQKIEDTRKVFQVNVFSAIEIMSVLSRKKYKTNLKNVLFFSSLSSIRGKPGYAVYASAKSALFGLMSSLALELKPIKINTIVLGAVKTKATQFILNEKEEYFEEHIPLGLAKKNVLDHWMLFLLEGKTWMTGQKIIIDGGTSVL
jgi:NAD(P)-dependent dehydrogenase (short-subunit alcohol dehydrogenase family)|tara:strand:- start:834 stop:1544 length:711 start_codon:yes stop_codon:yes gene_type:complete